MTFSEFEASLVDREPSASLPLALQALWWDAAGAWDKAHGRAEDGEGDSRCDWVHAYLHRKQGDSSNAAYWYRRAGKRFPDLPISEEWRAIASELTGAPAAG